ncbi:MAG: FKBP-type peptidyl-prolyl cis-trans isomerase [Bacteroidaceae bacterium]
MENQKNQQNKYIAVNYKLYDISDGEKELIEETPEGHPFQFISGMGLTLDKFEKELAEVIEGGSYEIEMTASEAYGERNEEYVISLDKNIFEIEGKFDDEHIKPGAVVPLMGANGERMNGTCVEVKDDKVIMDMNHPLAGIPLHFEGTVVTNREATNEEIQEIVKSMTGEGSSCGCGDGCGDGCSCGDGCNC